MYQLSHSCRSVSLNRTVPFHPIWEPHHSCPSFPVSRSRPSAAKPSEAHAPGSPDPGSGGGGSSGGGGGPPSESTEPAAKAKKTPFTADENALYLTLLRRHGRPLKKNAEAWAAFRNAFPNRSSDSWAGHMQHFTTDEAGEWVVKTGVD